ncbi:MAG: hypothetical protein A3I44_01025 [Candidatus Sungbacteria bacterium RIFCSPLOWO2_02_FULL_51_17]|uniref:Uncharacterized protein n=1 Tax=Candidatus Sungbacteria bacterium RIFCSPHIGHO2_02_FULL_51_29 TaxID=1802273 RepID=A0A1G2KX68_9BACT|nr:MAG: hypothetical protein A2676_00425 [Candidatus Sungbacteria bacterium RIFCSPHIGHO2_01_FULL_51_22]OHA03804.1 MAG: hypothetical protein A3C16_05095 [Candidatus Sungbacteria bacterium RIFCSPHIGHO2_02_FULL_51_29]OHA07448.1 MAG: hypothetical protein A3B29_02180 [Candidatus Sungbacteria bacterium RIFCSPLOWO2_01_FULL_51_34]OHA10960.1 MAG: hypothetical protein A3I44_01025 [Candidatus Sungbacteria bacterium RIFCSPLOWO2_02_FULL_51_17]
MPDTPASPRLARRNFVSGATGVFIAQTSKTRYSLMRWRVLPSPLKMDVIMLAGTEHFYPPKFLAL